MLLSPLASSGASLAASTITVTTLNDVVSADGLCSLREAINNINEAKDTTGGECTSGATVATIDFAIGGTIKLTQGVLTISRVGAVINGDGITLDGGGGPILALSTGVNYLNDLTFTNGSATNGGAISVMSPVHISGCVFEQNSAAAHGGAIYATGAAAVIISDSEFDGNVAAGGGGAIFDDAVEGLTISSSSFISNSVSTGGGGAIYSVNSAASVGASTFETNTASSQGGAIYNAGRQLDVESSTFDTNSGSGGGAVFNGPGASSKIVNSTFYNNSAAGPTGVGGATFNRDGVMGIRFCTFVSNAAGQGGAICDISVRPNGTNVGDTILVSNIGGNCSAPTGNIYDGSYNTSDDKTCGFTGTGAQGQTLGDGVAAKLDPSGLAENGGPTETIAELPDSPSVDAVLVGVCHTFTTADQRGESRPDPEDGPTGPCDIGAYELPGGAPAPSATATQTPTATPTVTPKHPPTPTPTPTAAPTATATEIRGVVVGFGGTIQVTFHPLCTHHCNRVDWIQVLCETATLAGGGTRSLQPNEYRRPDGTYSGAVGANHQARTVNAAPPGAAPRYCYVDRLDGYASPFFGMADGFDSARNTGAATSGVHNPTADVPRADRDSSMGDRPTEDDRVAGPPGSATTDWQTLDTNLGGTVNRITDDFEVCVFCREGPDQGTVYGCQSWTDTFTRPAGGAGPVGVVQGTVTLGAVSTRYTTAWRNAANEAVTQYGLYPNGPDVNMGLFQ